MNPLARFAEEIEYLEHEHRCANCGHAGVFHHAGSSYCDIETCRCGDYLPIQFIDGHEDKPKARYIASLYRNIDFFLGLRKSCLMEKQ